MTKVTDSKFDVVDRFHHLLKNELEFAIPVAAIKVLTEVIERDGALTMTELLNSIDLTTSLMKQASFINPIPVSAGCDLFQRFLTRSAPDFSDFTRFKKHLVERGNSFVTNASRSRGRIAGLAVQFIRDDSVILVHSFSRVVMSALQLALGMNKRFRVYVTESRPSSAGLTAVKALTELGIPTTLILDCAVGYVMDQVDLVLVGAEGVVENGGLINQIGTYQLSIVAKANNKPFYCLAESFKFVRLFPLNQSDLPTNTESVVPFVSLPPIQAQPQRTDVKEETKLDDITNIMVENPTLDYTPPSYITLLVTDLGVLTPSGVSDELIKLYF